VTSRFVAAMALTDTPPRAPVDNLAVRGGYRGPKARGRGQNRSGGSQRNNSGNQQQAQPLTCFHCGKQGHITQECRVPASAIVSQPAALLRDQNRPPPSRAGNHLPVANIDTANPHS
jgi:hypothetical protein